MGKIKVVYEGDLHTIAIHEETAETLHTDAPKDNQGKGQTFSPTDLVGTALATCMATVMGIYAKRHQIDLRGMVIEATKIMSQDAPRRIRRLEISIFFPKELTVEVQKALLQVAESCPVHHSLNPEIEIPITTYTLL